MSAPNIPKTLIAEALGAVSSSTLPVMLFGSFARGDDAPESDIDVLVLTTRSAPPKKVGRVNVSTYTETTLSRMGDEGALFILHLLTDGVILRDDQQRLRSCLDRYKSPLNYHQVRSSLKDVADLLDVPDEEYVQRWRGYNDAALYLVRTLLYADFAMRGAALFSLKTIQAVMKDAELDRAINLKKAHGPTPLEFHSARSLVGRLLGTPPINRFGTPEALITNKAPHNPSVLVFGLRILGRSGESFGYPDIALVGQR